MRILFVLLTFIAIAFSTLPQAAEAQGKATSYDFASSKHYSVEKKNFGLSGIIEYVDHFLEKFRGKKGILLFLGAGTLSALAAIYGMMHASIAAGIIAGLIFLINFPVLFFGLVVPGYAVYRWKKKSGSDDDSDLDDPNLSEDEKVARKIEIRARKKMRSTIDNLTHQNITTQRGLPSKLSRPL